MDTHFIPDLKTMDKDDIINLSSDSSDPPSPSASTSQSGSFNNFRPNVCLLSSRPINVESNYCGFEKLSRPKSSSWENPHLSRIVHSLSDSNESDFELPDDNDHSEIKMLQAKYGLGRIDASTHLDFPINNKPCDSLKTFDIPVSSITKNDPRTLKTKNLTKEQRLQEKMRKEKEKEESKLKKQKEKEDKQAKKLALQELQKHMKPGHCTKLMTVILDDSLITCSFGGTLLAAIQNSESKCEVLKKAVANTISWARDLPGGNKKDEDDLILIWQWQTVIPTIKNHTLCFEIEQIQSMNPNKIVFLVIYGLSTYFSYLKRKRKNVSGSGELSSDSKRRKTSELDAYPYLTRKAIEEELIELQLMANCNHRLIESAEDLAQFVVQTTKAIAETPFKLDKQRRELENLEWFAVGDSRDCVSVDKEGHGLLRLWQQQLCQFNLAGHDVAQAITAVYPSPLSLAQAYKQCTSQKEGEGLLKDIQVRRCQGPLSSSRRVGPELSKKIYTFFCSSDGEAPLSQEQ